MGQAPVWPPSVAWLSPASATARASAETNFLTLFKAYRYNNPAIRYCPFRSDGYTWSTSRSQSGRLSTSRGLLPSGGPMIAVAIHHVENARRAAISEPQPPL